MDTVVGIANSELSKLYPDKPPIKTGSRWAKAFQRRHKDILSVRKIEKRSQRRVEQATPEAIASFFNVLQQLHETHGARRRTRNSQNTDEDPVSAYRCCYSCAEAAKTHLCVVPRRLMLGVLMYSSLPLSTLMRLEPTLTQ